MSLKTTIFLIASVLYPGESVWEEAARVPVIPATAAECNKQLRLAGNMAKPGRLQVIFSCYDESAPVDGEGGVSSRAGYSLEKYLPKGAVRAVPDGGGGDKGDGNKPAFNGSK